MTVAHYKIWNVGPSVGIGATQSVHVGVAAIAKRNIAGQPYIVPNELICAALASACRLPIPPGFLVKHEDQSAFVSMNFNLSGENLPPADPDAIVAAHPSVAWGITLFDVWVCNLDRHNGNLSYNVATNTPQIFDHSHALFGQGGRAHLEAQMDALAIGGHCLAGRLTTLSMADEWLARICAVPEFYVRSVCAEVDTLGVAEGESAWVADFLLERRTKIKALVNANRGQFPSVQDWSAWT